MNRIAEGEYIAAYDSEIGVVYAPKKGKLMATTPKHAKSIENCLEQYFNERMTECESRELEEYMQKQFGKYQELAIKEYVGLRESKHLQRLEIMVANDCNLNCKYCYAHGGNYGMAPQRMTPDMAKDYLKQLVSGKYKEIGTVMFFGGEPAMCPDTIKTVCEYFGQEVSAGYLTKMPVFTMVTNGTLIDDKLADIIHQYDIHVTVSIDGPPEINDQLRVDKGGKGTFERIKQGIESMKKRGDVPKMLEATYTTKHQEMGYGRDDIRSYLSRLFGIKQIYVADCQDNSDDKKLVFREREADISDKSDDYSGAVDKIRIGKALTSKTYNDIACSAGIISLALLPNGDLYPCHAFLEHPEYKIASFSEGRFDFAHYDKVLEKLLSLRKSENHRCKGCWAAVVCRACPANMLFNGQRYKDEYCRTEKETIKYQVLECAKEQYLSKKQG